MKPLARFAARTDRGIICGSNRGDSGRNERIVIMTKRIKKILFTEYNGEKVIETLTSDKSIAEAVKNLMEKNIEKAKAAGQEPSFSVTISDLGPAKS